MDIAVITITPLFFILFSSSMPIVYYMQVDTQVGSLFLSTDTNHSRYVTQYITSGSSLIGREINTIEVWNAGRYSSRLIIPFY